MCTTEHIKAIFDLKNGSMYINKKKHITVVLQQQNDKKYIRQSHVGAWIKGHLNDNCAIDINFLACGGVATGYSASLVKSMRLHTSSIIANKHLQNHWLVHTFQLLEAKRERQTVIYGDSNVFLYAVDCSVSMNKYLATNYKQFNNLQNKKENNKY